MSAPAVCWSHVLSCRARRPKRIVLTIPAAMRTPPHPGVGNRFQRELLGGVRRATSWRLNQGWSCAPAMAQLARATETLARNARPGRPILLSKRRPAAQSTRPFRRTFHRPSITHHSIHAPSTVWPKPVIIDLVEALWTQLRPRTCLTASFPVASTTLPCTRNAKSCLEQTHERTRTSINVLCGNASLSPLRWLFFPEQASR